MEQEVTITVLDILLDKYFYFFENKPHNENILCSRDNQCCYIQLLNDLDGNVIFEKHAESYQWQDVSECHMKIRDEFLNEIKSQVVIKASKALEERSLAYVREMTSFYRQFTEE